MEKVRTTPCATHRHGCGCARQHDAAGFRQPTPQQAGQVAERMRREQRCPHSMEELEQWCEDEGLRKGGLEGLKALRYWPQIARKYAIPVHDASMVNLLYMAIYGTSDQGCGFFRDDRRQIVELLPGISATNSQPSLRRSTAESRTKRSDGSPGERCSR